MKTVTASLSLHLAQETTTLARLLKISRVTDGAILRLTDFDQDIPYNELTETDVNTPAIFSSSGINSGTASRQASATVTPGSSTDFALFVTNNDPNSDFIDDPTQGNAMPSAWMPSASGIYTLFPSGSSPISLTGLSSYGGSPDRQWANVIATFTTTGTPALAQASAAWANNMGTGAHNETLG